MTATDWTPGKGLNEDGSHDTSWNGRDTIGITRAHGKWQVRIQWGSTWGNITYATFEDFNVALAVAVKDALDHGCPPDWLPHPLTLSAAHHLPE